MIRHPCLQALSRDHHHALVLSKRATRAAGGSTEEQLAMCEQLATAFAQDLEPHFVIEEKDLPALLAKEPAAQPLLAQFAAEHATLRRLAAALSNGQCAMLEAFASALAGHVRFEERELFPAIEQVLARNEAGPR
jgi:hypothetical protein